VNIACAIVADLLAGLHAAHEACDERGQPLHIIHRDVSPPNTLVGSDGVARVLDFGVAKAVGRLQQTREGEVKGKLRYMAPEQVRGTPLTRAVDIYAASVVLWETLTGKRLFTAEHDADVVEQILFGTIDAPSVRAPDIPEALNAIVLRGLARDPSARYATAREMGRALRDCVRLASASVVGDWVEETAGGDLADRATAVAAIDAGTDVGRISRVSRISLSGLRTRESAAIVLPPEAVGTEVAILGNVPSGPGEVRRSRRLWMALAGLTLAAAAGIAVGARARHPEAPPASPASAPAGSSVAALPATSASTGSSADPPAASVAVAPTLEASSQPPPVRPHPGTPARPRPRSDCNPPYTTDPDGTRHYKLQCL
jgi:serine/threonine-protein kinase